MKRILLACVLAACTKTHDGTQMEIAAQDCSNCHSGTLTHPEELFPLLASNGSMHADIACNTCHRFDGGPGIFRFHADCTSAGCHPQSAIEPNHLPRPGFMWDPVNNDFCLNCHSAGTL